MSALFALGIVYSSMLGLAQGKRPIVGGYKEISTDDPQAQAAAEFAVAEQGKNKSITVKLVSIEHAEQQVVAGMNYRLCLKVEIEGEGDDADTVQEAKVVVYRNLQNKYSLTSWEEEDCSESQ